MNKWMRVLAVFSGIGLLLSLIAFVVLQQPPFGGKFEGFRLERMKASPEYKNGRFENTPPQKTDSNLLHNYELYSQGQVRKPRFEIPVVKLDPANHPTSAKPGLRAYWFGHASALIEVDGVRVMTDPVFSNVAGPYEIPIGPERMHPAPLPLEQMPKVDAVVISHDHFDHLDMKAIQHFASQGTHFYVGLGIGAHLVRWEVPAGQIHEMDWWDSLDLGVVKIHCTPARHYSGRRSMDNSTLWSSWYIQGPKHSFYFSGDTGYSPHFSEIKKRLGAPDLSVMKVGSYGLTWLDIHMDPEHAVQAHQDLGGKTLLPVHWATFNLSYHSWEEPIVRTIAAASAKSVQVITPRPGEEFEFGKPFKNTEWYLGK